MIASVFAFIFVPDLERADFPGFIIFGINIPFSLELLAIEKVENTTFIFTACIDTVLIWRLVALWVNVIGWGVSSIEVFVHFLSLQVAVIGTDLNCAFGKILVVGWFGIESSTIQKIIVIFRLPFRSWGITLVGVHARISYIINFIPYRTPLNRILS